MFVVDQLHWLAGLNKELPGTVLEQSASIESMAVFTIEHHQGL